jgi:hypothetical protein
MGEQNKGKAEFEVTVDSTWLRIPCDNFSSLGILSLLLAPQEFLFRILRR